MDKHTKAIEEKLSNHMKEVFESLHEKELKLSFSTSPMKIVSPGKFEAMPFYIPFLYDCSLDHWDHIEEVTESDDSPVYWLKLEHEDYINLKIDRQFNYVGIFENNEGFINYDFK